MLRRSIEFTSRKQTLELLFIDTVLDFESRQAVSDGTVTIQASKTQTIYCHGLPGSAREISMLVDSDESNILVMGPNDIERFETVIGSKQIETAHVIGFSLGAMAAIEIAAKYPQLSKKLSLIAPAAPLELGDFLPDMAGRSVFRAAQQGAIMFRLFTFLQNLGFKLAPEKLIHSMFSESPAADRKLLEDPNFQANLMDGLRSSLGKNSSAYQTSVRRYVNPWAEKLKTIQCPVTIHHGDEDNWAPISMSHALAKKIRSSVVLATYPKLGHYSTLYDTLPTILKEDLS